MQRVALPDFSAHPARSELEHAVARTVADGESVTRADLTRALGLPRSSVTAIVDHLIDRNILRQRGWAEQTSRGRPGELLTFTTAFGCVLAVDADACDTRLLVSSFSQETLAECRIDVGFRDGPEPLLNAIATLVEELDSSRVGKVISTVLGLPASIDTRSSTPVVRGPADPSWIGFPIVPTLAPRIGRSVVVEKDSNLGALAEARRVERTDLPLLYVMIDGGVGGGIIYRDDQIYRGADGSAGEIGHLTPPGFRPGDDAKPCACGRLGCLETIASIPAILHRLGYENSSPSEQMHRLESSDPAVRDAVALAAQAVGKVVAMLVQSLNPAQVVLGGDLIERRADLLASVRTAVYETAHPLATRNLVLARSTLGDRGELLGATIAAIEEGLRHMSLQADAV